MGVAHLMHLHTYFLRKNSMTLSCPPDLTAIISPFVARGKRGQPPCHYVSPEDFRTLTVASPLLQWRQMAMANDSKLDGRVRAFSRREFEERLDRVDLGGPLAG